MEEKTNSNNGSTVVIRRYRNRKLYDTSRGCYTHFAGILQSIMEGSEVQIIDFSKPGAVDITQKILPKLITFKQTQKLRQLSSAELAKEVRAAWAGDTVPTNGQLTSAVV